MPIENISFDDDDPFWFNMASDLIDQKQSKNTILGTYEIIKSLDKLNKSNNNKIKSRDDSFTISNWLSSDSVTAVINNLDISAKNSKNKNIKTNNFMGYNGENSRFDIDNLSIFENSKQPTFGNSNDYYHYMVQKNVKQNNETQHLAMFLPFIGAKKDFRYEISSKENSLNNKLVDLTNQLLEKSKDRLNGIQKILNTRQRAINEGAKDWNEKIVEQRNNLLKITN